MPGPHPSNPPVKLASAQVAGLTAPTGTFKYSQGPNKEKKDEIQERISSPQEAFKYLLHRFLNDPDLQEVASKDDFAYLCHRVVHGGDFEKEAVITEGAYNYLLALKELAPLYSMPDYVKTYPISPEKAKENWLRKYGFHGISYSFITKDMHISTAKRILNKQSGWKSLAGTTDFSQIATETPATDQHRLAFDIFVDRIVGFIGNYVVKLDGHVDALVFAGGIGEKSTLLRKKVVEKCRCLGFVIDHEANGKGLADGYCSDGYFRKDGGSTGDCSGTHLSNG
ncbi:acetate kinase [Blastomyces gilchristii SLH14081]|uniref:Acetate kinase n=1 Tax=Blastomyces gilchristii (strain SLH14081) TaxID=559298 RepID=A0A179UFJ4_BLAGS|nr:acetate kinase [Blastomyces gilchristii SLH14081]OAT06744.1 acetate kinase [Blastomyces gilchristii SLH14081]